jgi:hypothetical protein
VKPRRSRLEEVQAYFLSHKKAHKAQNKNGKTSALDPLASSYFVLFVPFRGSLYESFVERDGAFETGLG